MTANFSLPTASSASAAALPKDLLPGRMPSHVAVIMDGNGRWAKRRGLPRVMGHRKGVETLKKLLRCCRDWGVSALNGLCFFDRKLGPSYAGSRFFDDAL